MGHVLNPGDPAALQSDEVSVELRELLRELHPRLNEGAFVFASPGTDTDLGILAPLATFREAEGVSVVLEENTAQLAGLHVLFRAAWITLTVRSELSAIGLTAAVATALAHAGIPCNVVAAAFHDHLFVPVESANLAMEVLQALQREALEETSSQPAQA